MRIQRFPTKTVIHGYKPSDARKIEGYLSAWDKVLFRYTFQAFKYDEDNETMIFPSGIDHDLLYSLLESKGYDIEEEDYRLSKYTNYKKINITMKYSPRDLLQRESIKFLLGSQYDKNNSQKLLSLNTGEGKTFCGVSYVSLTGRTPIIFINNNKLLEQWKQRILEYTDTTEDEIYILQGRNSINKLMSMKVKEARSYKFFIAMNKTIINVLEEDELFLENLAKHTEIALKIFDEVHLDYRNVFNLDISLDTPSIYLSATPGRSDHSENIVFKNIFYKVPKFSSSSVKENKRDIPDKYHTVVLFKLNTKPTEVDVADFMKASRRRGIDVNHYSNYLLNEEKMIEYFDVMIEILDKMSRGRKTIIMFRLTEQIDKFYDYLEQEKGIDFMKDNNVIRFHSKIDKNEKEKIDDSNLIITTVQSLGTGIDISGLKMIINTVPISSNTSLTQLLGRLRYIKGEKVVMIDVIDYGFKSLSNQANRRMTLYKKKAKEIFVFKHKSMKVGTNNGS